MIQQFSSCVFFSCLILFILPSNCGFAADLETQSCRRILSSQQWIEFALTSPHDFTIQYPPRREYFKENYIQRGMSAVPSGVSPWLLYVHIPFCEKKCFYCNFAVDVRKDQVIFDRYMDALEAELDNYKNLERPIAIDIGGGTPTQLPIDQLQRLMTALQKFRGERNQVNDMSIETTPNIASSEKKKLFVLLEGGISRVSMGVQSFNESLLSQVNRGHQLGESQKAAENIHSLNFERFNVDVIFGLPGQSELVWKEDLKRVVSLEPDSITTYDCLYRGKGRKLTKEVNHCAPPLEHYGRLYDIGYDYLTSEGYFAPYGSVNFSKRQDETGTSTYFEGRLLDGLSYIGTGVYSSSWINDRWFFNLRSVNRYIEAALEGRSTVGDDYFLPDEELWAKYILFSLSYGIIDEKRFARRFGRSFSQVFHEQLDFATEQGWIIKDGDIWRIPYGQFKNINFLRSLFYSDKAKSWLMNL